MRKLSLLICLILGQELMAHAQGVSVQGQAIVNTTTSVSGIPGNTVLQAVPNAQITVCSSAGGGIPCSPLVTIYSNVALTVVAANPLTADANGNFSFFIPPNATGYIYSQTGSGITGQLFTISPQTNVASVTPIFGANCTAGSLSTAVATLPPAGTLDARACTTAFTWSSTITISSPMTFFMPCANVTFTTQLLNITSDDVHIHFCGGGTSGQIANYTASTAGSTYTASGLGAATNAIVAAKTTRGSQNAARLSGLVIDNAIINMNNVGNRAIYMSSAWSPRLDHVIAYGGNCSDGLIYQEADEVGDGTLFAASYFADFNHVISQISQTNTTCHPFYFDSTNGEIAYGHYVDLFGEGFPQAAGSGADSFYVSTGSTNINQSFDQNVFVNLKTQDPTDSATVYGMKLQCRGNFAAQTGGRCFNDQFLDAQPERIFSTGGFGVGIGCVNNAGAADGTGCGFIVNQNLSAGGWGNNEDVANLGAGYMSVSDNAAFLQGPIFRQSGLHQGATSQFERIDPTYTPLANGQSGFSVIIEPQTANPSNFTGATLQGLTVDMADGTHSGGNFGTVYGIQCNGFISWATSPWCLFMVGGAGNHMDSWLEIGTASVANPGGVANGGRLWYNQAAQQFNTSDNNGTFFPLPQTGNTSGTHSDSGFYQTATAAGCTTAASIGGVCATAITITWPTAFADANYKVNCTPVGAPTNLPSNPYVVTPIAASVTVNYYAITAAAASWPNVTCEAVHN